MASGHRDLPRIMQIGWGLKGARLGVNKWADTQHADDTCILSVQAGEVLQDVRAHLSPGRGCHAAQPAQDVLPGNHAVFMTPATN